jgi:hypothetical protein
MRAHDSNHLWGESLAFLAATELPITVQIPNKSTRCRVTMFMYVWRIALTQPPRRVSVEEPMLCVAVDLVRF